MHPSIGGLFAPNSEEVKAFIKGRANQKLEYLEKEFIGHKHFVVGNSFTVADSYLFIVLSWTQYVGIDLAPFPNVSAYYQRISELPNVKAAKERMAENPSSVL